MSDPIFRGDRACKNVGVNMFFPPAQRKRLVQRAQAICSACPVLTECAQWAAPLVASWDLSDCVVAGVHIPIDRSSTRYRAAREVAVQQLREVAAGQEPVADEGGAAWTAA